MLPANETSRRPARAESAGKSRATKPGVPAVEPTELTPAQIALREQLMEFADVLNLPIKRKARIRGEVAAAVAEATRLRIRYKRWALAIAGSLLFAWLAYSPPAPIVLPWMLVGEWTTTHPRYQGNTLAFTKSEVIIGLPGDAAPTHYPIKAMDFNDHGDTSSFRLTYGIGESEMELQGDLISRSPALLVFARPDDLVWVHR